MEAFVGHMVMVMVLGFLGGSSLEEVLDWAQGLGVEVGLVDEVRDASRRVHLGGSGESCRVVAMAGSWRL